MYQLRTIGRQLQDNQGTRGMTDRVNPLQFQEISQSHQVARMVPDSKVRGRRVRSVARPSHPDDAKTIQGRARGQGREPIRKDAGVNQQQRLTRTTLGIFDLSVPNHHSFNCLGSAFHLGTSAANSILAFSLTRFALWLAAVFQWNVKRYLARSATKSGRSTRD